MSPKPNQTEVSLMLPIIAGVIIAVPPVLIWIRINSLEYDINNNINALKCKLDNTIPK